MTAPDHDGSVGTPADPAHITQIRLGGFGGQGVVLAGKLLGKAAAVFDGKDAICTQSYGPEARGGASKADVIIADAPVDYPFVTEPDILAVLFQEAYEKYRGVLRPGGVLIVETDLVTTHANDVGAFALPATRIAEELGNRVVTNVVLLGYLTGLTATVSRDAAEQAIRTTVKPRVVDINLRAFDAGFERALRDKAA